MQSPISSPTCPQRQIMSTFKNNLVRVGKFCDHGYKVLFEKHSVTIFTKNNSVLLTDWREKGGARLWRFFLRSEDHQSIPTEWNTVPSALNAHNLTGVGALTLYLHIVPGFPVGKTWLAAIKAGNYSSWPGLLFAHASKYCPLSTETIKGHLAQSCQEVRFTKRKH